MQNINELEEKIIDIINYDDGNTIYFIKSFISKCSLADFEKLKDLEYDLTTQENKEV